MALDEEERKRRYERARQLSNSINPSKTSSNTTGGLNSNFNTIVLYNYQGNTDEEREYVSRFQRARQLSNSINPRQNVPAPSSTDEEIEQGHKNVQGLLSLMDKNTQQDINSNNIQQEESNPNANSRFRINNTKSKEEVDKQIQQASSQNVQPNTNNENNNSIVDNDIKIGLASEQETQNAQELTQTDIEAMSEANRKNENIEKGGLAKFEEIVDTFFDNIIGGVKQTVSGLANVVTTGAALGLRGLEGAAGILGLEDASKSLNKAYNSTVEAGSNVNEIANYERTVNSQVEDDLTKTVGDVTNVISNMVSSQVIGYALPSNVPGVVIQGLSVGGNSAQEVLDENKDNIGQATLTGLAKGYTSYLTEKMFDANILTRGMKKEKKSIQNAVDKLISDKINSQFGKEAANRVVGILGENAEELVEDNIDNIIDNIINKKDTPEAFSEEWWANTSETAKITTISTIVMSLLGLGGESFHEKEVDMEANYWIDQAQQFIEQEDMAIHFNPSEVKTMEDTKDFYITRFTPEGEIANVVATRGKTIANPNQELNVKPAIVKDNITSMYNVIDEDTGVVLDSTPYSTTMEAESGFDEKVNKLSDIQIKDINQKIDKASYTVTNQFARVIDEARNELAQMTPVDYGVNTRQNTQQNQEQERQKFEDINKTINQISDKSVYNQTAVDDLLDTVSNNINNIEYVQEDDGGGILYSFDNDRNITGQQNINGKVFSGKKIKSIVNTAIQKADTTSLYQETNTNSTQTISEPNTTTFYSNSTNYAVQDINKVTDPFSKQESYSRDELAETWNDEVSGNNYDAYYDSNGNIERYIAIEEDGNNIVANQYDNNDNVVKSEVIPSENGRYKASDIQDTLNRVASLYDENRPIKGQQDIEGNEVKRMKKKTNSSKNIDINKSIEKFEKAKNNIDRETVVNIANSLDIKIKEGATKIEDTNMSKLAGKNKTPSIITIDELFKDLTSKNIKEYRKEAENIANNLYRDKIVKIFDTQTDTEINKSGIEKTLSGNITKSKIQSINKLQDIIEQGIYGYTTYNPDDNNGILYHHFFTPVNYQNNNGLIRVVIREFTHDNSLNDKYYYHQLEFISNKKIEGINALPQINGNKEIKFLPSTKNSISQNSKTVKNETKTKTNKSQTNKTIKSLEDIKVKYKNQTDQLNIFENKDNTISINNLVVKQNLRNKGIGQSILNDIIDYADKNGKTITLTPTSQYLTKNRLTNWYKKNGFVENKGRNTNYSISDTMYRLPKTSNDDGVRAMKNTSTKVTDSEGRTLTKQQQEYFKDSKVRDENGDLQVVYHGTNNFGFTKFNRNINYYTSREDVANTYTGNNGIYRGYLDIKEPIVINANKEKWSMIDIDNIKINGINNIREFLNEQGASVWQEKGKTRTSTADLVQAISDAIDEGEITADGIIIQNIYDEGSYNNGEAKLGTDYITFKSNQFKNLDNSSPTSNNDIRYMKKSNSRNRTNTTNNSKNLIAQHNTSEEKLMEALDLGALPVPSIAITKSDTPISNYGDITLLFNKDTINPTDRRNVAYNSDIYSTRRLQTVNSLDKNKVKAFEKSMNNKGISYGYISQIEEYIQDNDFTRAKDTIRYELQKANPDITEQEIEDSFTEAMEIIKDKRILREDVDPYTPSGNRRTIEQMSVPYTLDNIVRLMTKKSNKGSESNNFAGLPEVRANLSQQFKNIEEMHQQENDLVSTEEMQKVKEQLNDEFYNLIDEIGKYDKVERYFGSTDTVANALNETAKAKNISKEVLENELDFVSITNVPDKTLQKAIDFLNSLKNVPTEYFEVKPQRAVGLNEIQSAIVPKNTSKELIDKLKENNIPITYYDTQQERNKIIANETENKNIRFAKKTAKTPKVEGEILEPGQTNAQRESNYIEQEIRKIEESGNWDDSIPVTRMTDIRKTIEDYLGIGVQKGHFRQQAYGIYKGNRDVIRTKELKDMDTILHETGHALDIGKRINLNKESIANELLTAVNKYGGYEAETRDVQLEEGFAEVIREYTIVPNQARIDYPQTVSILEGIRQTDKDFNKFITDVQQQTYNYIHQNPRNRTLSNVSIGERTDQTKLTPAKIQQEVMRNIYDKDWALKSAVNEMQKINGKSTRDLKASENAYYLTRLSSGIGDKVISMLSKGYIDENGTKLMPGLEQLGEILGNNEQRFNDLRAYLVAQRDLEYKAKTLKTGIRTMDSKAVVEQFKNDTQIQESSKLVYDTLDGVMQYAVNNGLISQETADSLRESNAFYVPMQRVLEGSKNNVGRRGAVSDIIKARTGSELDVKDVLENIVANSANIIQQVENNNILRALYNQGEQAGMTGKIYDVIDAPMVKIGTAKLSTWERELRNQGVDTTELDLEKTIDLFAPNNKVDTNNLITSFIDTNGKRVYLQFNDEVLFNSLMNMDKKFMSAVLNINRKLNMPLRYGATMANIGFAIPNMISDTTQAAIFSEAGFIPVVDNVIGIMDILSAQNKTARNFFNKVVPGYADRINTLYAIYEQTGATSSTRMSQYRETTQNLMKDVYGTKNSKVLGIKEKYKPLKRLLDIMTYIPEISEQSTRFRVFEKNIEYYRKNGMAETDARIQAALQSRDATQDFGRTGNITREINQLIPFSAARVGSAYTFAEKVKGNPKRVASRMAILMVISTAIKAIGYDDDEIEELNQRKKDDNFVLKVGDQIVTIKKPQGILRSIINLGEYVQDLFTGHIEEGKEGERLVELVQSAIMDNMPADSVTGLVPNMIAPVVENAINKDLYYNSDIVKSYDLELPDSEQYYDYNSQLAIWLGQIFNYSPAKIDNLISGYFAGLGTSVTNVIDWIAGKAGITAEEPNMGAEDNAVGKRFFVNVNSNSQSVDDVYTLKTDLTKKANGGTITPEEEKQLEAVTEATSNMAKLNKQIKEIKKSLTLSADEKAEQIRVLQEQKTDTARQALGKELLYSNNEETIESTKFYPSRDTLSQNKRTLTLTSEMKKEYEEKAYEYYQKYEKQGLYSEEKLEQIKEKAKDYAKSYMMNKYKSELVRSEE